MLQIAYSSYSWLLNISNQKDGLLFPAAFSFLVAILGISVWTIRKPRKAIAPLPPGPRGLPIVGYLPFLGIDNLHLVFTDLAATYGPIYKLWLGNKLCVVINSPSLAKEVVRDNDIAFSERDPPVCAKIVTFGLNDIVFDSYSNPDWRKKRKDFLQLLLELKQKNDSASSITLNQLKALLMDVVVGGTDTTSTMMEWTMAELMEHPEAMEKVKKEIADVVGPDGTVDESHLPNLRYLDAAVKETFRLHPPMPLLVPRCPGETSIVGGYSVPKGTRVFLNIWCIQRDAELWENPLEFKPERFLNDKFDYLGNDSRYMPFGSGRRMCAGVSLGERMLYSSLAALIHAFDWKLAEGTENDLTGRFGIIMKKMKPLIVVPTPRSSNLQHYVK
ncbi:Copper amine oxidase family protein [Hibiscus syriacus]|uniref:Copper amine oxidase family protein n=1 Tax=Hibiscus syriacus TaxID=106335 RepID=A0A6A2XQW5_HIBSY|nr:Copper amine oxidase family protein [Hibiscus syriacus]